MASIVRGTKSSAGGGTAFVTNTTIVADEVNTDFDTIVTAINGNLDSTNLASAADIAETQIGDISATAATHDDTTTPGDSSSHTLPTTLSGEVQQLRYVEERLALGVGATRVDGSGTGTAFWGDLPARGGNLLTNPHLTSLVSGNTVPYGWSDLGTGTPTFSQVALTGATLTEGLGAEFRIQAGSAAVAGISTTATLKAATRYLVVARARLVTNSANLTITGANATSSFRNFTASTSSTSYVTIKGVIQTDTTPTVITIKLTTSGANGDDVRFAYVGLFECAADLTTVSSSGVIEATSTASVTIENTTFTNLLGKSVTIRVPSTGYDMHVEAIIPIASTSGASQHTVTIRLEESGGSVPGALWEGTMTTNGNAVGYIHHVIPAINISVTAGLSYVWTVTGRSTSAGSVTTPGTTLVTGTPTRTMYLRAWLVKVA